MEWKIKINTETTPARVEFVSNFFLANNQSGNEDRENDKNKTKTMQKREKSKPFFKKFCASILQLPCKHNADGWFERVL